MISPQLRRWLAIGAGIGIEIDGDDLVVTAVRVRFTRIQVLGECRIASFASRPSAEWGAEYEDFAKSVGLTHLAAYLLLPRDTATVRLLSLPPLKSGEMEAALQFQIDSLHPYSEDDVTYAWSALERSGDVLVAIVPAETVSRFQNLFVEAGIELASVTVAPAVFYSSVRLLGEPVQKEFAALEAGPAGIEIYGESTAKAVYSLSLTTRIPRLESVVLAELRLSPEQPLLALRDVLPRPQLPSHSLPPGDLAVEEAPETLAFSSTRSYAAALCAACPWFAPPLNLLPKDARRGNSRLLYVPTAVFATLLVVCAVALAGQNSWQQKKYLQKLNSQIAALEPRAQRATNLARDIQDAATRTQQIDAFRSRTKADLDAINELTRILPPPIWVSSFDLERGAVVFSGEASSAAGLLKTVDGSPLFENTAFLSGIGRTSNGTELFRIRSMREQVVP